MATGQSSTARDAGSDRSLLRRIVSASMAGTVVEWYDFFLYATAAALVFDKVLMPAMGNQYDGIIAAFVTYAVGFLARPLGGVIFGHLGDRLGRKHTLQLTIMLIGVATVLMGCLPSYDTIGLAAPLLLVLLRFVQGIALGGEWGGAVLLVAEHSPAKERATWAAWPQAAVPVGNLLATAVLWLMSTTLSDAAFLSWGWRVAFWLSAVVVVVGYWIRTSISDAPIFEQAKAELEEGKARSYGVVEVVRRYPRGVVTGMGLRFAENIMYYLVVSFSIVYLGTGLGMDTSSILGMIAIAHAFHFFVILWVGRLADRFGRRPVYLAGAILGGTWGLWAFPAFGTRSVPIILAVIMVGLLFHALMYAGQPAIMAEMFPTRMRYSGVSISYQVTSIVAGSLAPILATTWLRNTGSWWPTAVYLLVAGAITTVAVLTLRETRGSSLHELDERDREIERVNA
ncbi:MFS transporter [Isoptericola variabilis]|uniref:General substrate transporter n=1 Tax=Isoptericola variabilis (strain 225) TaxID=743718 RepID=F6FPG8_ISOV2|nr:MFS transporter [Isoptericola variabilis]AEG43681.1 General substrate transporter [Isoptericola variabilis 225]TWH27362.1 putative MFS family arabinose efflux permease [Isoptericola variabilis J7]